MYTRIMGDYIDDDSGFYTYPLRLNLPPDNQQPFNLHICVYIILSIFGIYLLLVDVSLDNGRGLPHVPLLPTSHNMTQASPIRLYLSSVLVKGSKVGGVV